MRIGSHEVDAKVNRKGGTVYIEEEYGNDWKYCSDCGKKIYAISKFEADRQNMTIHDTEKCK